MYDILTEANSQGEKKRNPQLLWNECVKWVQHVSSSSFKDLIKREFLKVWLLKREAKKYNNNKNNMINSDN